MMMEKQESPDFFLFLKPFKWQIWIALCFLWFFYATVLTMISIVDRKMRVSTRPKENFTFGESLQYFSMASVQLGTDKQPVSMGGKVLQQSWSMLCLIFVATYTANMAAIFSKISYTKPLKSIDEILKTNHSVYSHASYVHGFKSVNNRIINDLLRKERIEFKNFSQSSDWVPEFSKSLKDGGIWLVSSSITGWLKSKAEEGDRIYTLDGYFSRFPYSFAMKKNWQHVERVNDLLTRYGQSGVIDQIERKYKSQRFLNDNKDDGGESVSFFSFLGFFAIVFIVGLVALSITAIDYLCEKRRNSLT